MKRKEKKRKNEKEKFTVKYEEVGNIEKNDFCGFVCMSKISKRERKLTATNY